VCRPLCERSRVTLHSLLLAVVTLLAVLVIATSLSRWFGLGSVIALLAAGLALGPSGFRIAPDVERLRSFAELGVVLLMFTLGLEMEPRALWSMRRLVFGLGALQVLATAALLAGLFLLRAGGVTTSVLGGFGLALSSTAMGMPASERAPRDRHAAREGVVRHSAVAGSRNRASARVGPAPRPRKGCGRGVARSTAGARRDRACLALRARPLAPAARAAPSASVRRHAWFRSLGVSRHSWLGAGVRGGWAFDGPRRLPHRHAALAVGIPAADRWDCSAAEAGPA